MKSANREFFRAAHPIRSRLDPARSSYARRVHNPVAAAKVRGLFWQHQFPNPQANPTISAELRQQGYGRGGRMKIEQDQVEILSGVRARKNSRFADFIDDYKP